MAWIEYNKTFDEFVKDGLFRCGTVFEYMGQEMMIDDSFGLNPLQKIFCEENNIPEESFYESELWDKWRFEVAFKKITGFPELHDKYQKRCDELKEKRLYEIISYLPIKRKYLVGSKDYIYDEQFYEDFGFEADTKVLRYKKLNLEEIYA